MLKLAALFLAAETAAIAAANEENARLGDERSRGFDCGFAWVDIPTGRAFKNPETAEFLKWCKANGKGRARGYGKPAYQFWSPAHSSTQSVSVHYAGAAAFSLVLRNNGIAHASAGQRLD